MAELTGCVAALPAEQVHNIPHQQETLGYDAEHTHTHTHTRVLG